MTRTAPACSRSGRACLLVLRCGSCTRCGQCWRSSPSGSCALLAMLVLPGIAAPPRGARDAGARVLVLAGLPLTVKRAERLPPGQCVVVCNHASYLDGVVFTRRAAAALRLRHQARDVRRTPRRAVAAPPRARSSSSASTARAAPPMRAACCATPRSGSSLVFFPEGTFTRSPGLLKFHTGAFATRGACRLSGGARGAARHAPRSRRRAARCRAPGAIEVEILAAARRRSGGRRRARRCRRCATARARRSWRALGEPDLTCCDDTARPPRYSACEICPSEQTLTASISSANTLPPRRGGLLQRARAPRGARPRCAPGRRAPPRSDPASPPRSSGSAAAPWCSSLASLRRGRC